jgi:hypothetical protein
MRLELKVTLSLLVSLLAIGGSTAHAQDSSWGDLTVSAVRVDYDLSGVGSAPALAVRTTRDFTSHVSLELGGVYAKPDQQFGPSTLFMPETQLRYRWHVARVSPYVGAGVGAALVNSSFHSDWAPTLSMAAGTAVRLTDRLAATGEFRLRGHEWRFTGTTTELSAGLAWRLPSF